MMIILFFSPVRSHKLRLDKDQPMFQLSDDHKVRTGSGFPSSHFYVPDLSVAIWLTLAATAERRGIPENDFCSSES